MIIMMIVAGHKQRHMKSDSNRPATFSTSKAVIQAWWEQSTGVWWPCVVVEPIANGRNGVRYRPA